MAWFRPKEIKVPILPDSFGEDDPEPKASRPSPKDTFDKDTFDKDTFDKQIFDKPTFDKPTFDGVTVREERERPPILPKRAAFTVHASKNGETNEVRQDSPTLTVAKARGLFKTGWKVHIADSAGRRYAPSEFDEILRFDR